MNFFKNWYSEHKGYEIRPYADRILNKELPKAFDKKDVVVLAATPNSGKTLMAIAWMEKYLLDNPTHRMLVLTHNQNVLRKQFYNDIVGARVNFTFDRVDNIDDLNYSDSQVIVTLPKTIIGSLEQNDSKFDVLVVDEAHHYYNVKDGMVSQIIEKYKFRKQLLLTGTPAPFIAAKKDIIAVSLDELIEGEYCADPIVLIAKASYNITMDDFTKKDELKKDTKLKAEDTVKTLDNLLPIIESKLFTSGWRSTIETLGKTMIFCKSISQAHDVLKYFKGKKVQALLSTSDNDLNGDFIDEFIKSDVKILIVVDRGVLGFNLPELVCIIDMKCGKNISNLFQLFNRITRIHPGNKQKYYFKVIPSSLEFEYMYMLSAAIALMFKDNYIKYNGTPNEIVIPVVDSRVKTKAKEVSGKERESGKFQFEPINYIDVPVFKMWKQCENTYSWNTLKEVKGIKDFQINRNWKLYTQEENFRFCINTIKEYYQIA
jgi:superfamily II DNA or RNA helicase